jgi:hypothetical protein
MNLLQYYTQYFLKDAILHYILRYIWMNDLDCCYSASTGSIPYYLQRNDATQEINQFRVRGACSDAATCSTVEEEEAHGNNTCGMAHTVP